MKSAVFAMAVLVLAVGCGCRTVTCRDAVGLEPVKLVPEEWNGTWVDASGGGAVLLRVADAGKGVLKLSWVEFGDDGAPKAKSFDVLLRSVGDWVFASCREDGGSVDEGYPFYRVRKESRRILAWAPRADRFVELVKQGRLPGELIGDDKTSVRLGALTFEHLQLIAGESAGVLFEWEAPIVLVRTSE